MVGKIILLEGLNRFNGVGTSPLVQKAKLPNLWDLGFNKSYF